MTVYHGTNMVIEHPNLSSGREDTDFGQGFYVTTNELMAKKWSGRKNPSIINTYELKTRGLTILKFELDEKWLNFVVANRSLNILPNTILDDVDLIIGPTADDKLFTTIEMYESGKISAQKAIRILNCMEIGEQICIKSEKALNQLSYSSFMKLTENERHDIKQIIRTDRKIASQLTSEILNEDQALTYSPFENLKDLIYVSEEDSLDDRDL